MLAIRDLHRQFGGVAAVDGVSFDVASGEVVAVIGPNGAGKTTAFNLITGVLRPDGGSVIMNGTDITGRFPSEICRLGLARTYQDVRTFRDMTVLDNIAVAAGYGRSKRLSAKQARGVARSLAGRLGIESVLRQTPAELNLFERKRVQLARALATEPKILLLDEQLAGLTPTEVRQAIEQISAIKTEFELTIILIEHLMGAVVNLAERTVVLDSGRVIASGNTREVLESEDVQRAYLGQTRT